MRRLARSCAATLSSLVIAACGGSTSDGGSSGARAGAGGSPADPGPSDCAPDGARIVLRGAYETVSTDAEAPPDDLGRRVAATGTDADGNFVLVGQAGDVGDADFVRHGTGTFDVADYPHSIQFVRMDPARSVIDAGFLALAGTLTVTEVQPGLRATFHLESLNDRRDIEDKLGTPRDGVVDGCIAVP